MKLYRMGEFGVRQDEPFGSLKKGDIVNSHSHTFPHITAIWGHMLVEVLDGENGGVVRSAEFGEHLGRTICLIRANTYHRLTVLKDGTQYRCIYTSRDADGTPAVTWSGELSGDFA